MSRDKVELSGAWSGMIFGMRHCWLSSGKLAATLLRDGEVLLGGPLREIVGHHGSGGMSYNEAQLLLACHDLMLPPLPEDMS